jgi:hypothetical protein
MLELTDDIAADWFLDLWIMAPTPAKTKHPRKATVERLLNRYHIRRVDAETVLHSLRQRAIKVAAGVAEAASVHIRSLVVRLHLVNRELRDAERKLDELCAALAGGENGDVAILKSLPGNGRIDACVDPRHSACRSFGTSQPPRLSGAADVVGCRARNQAERQIPHRYHALRRSPATSQHRRPLGTRRHST